MKTLPEALADAARMAGSTVGYVFVTEAGEVRRSYPETYESALRVAGALQKAGLRRGDLVALMIADAESFLSALYGASIAGLIPAPLAPPAATVRASRHVELMAAILRAARARAVVASGALVDAFTGIGNACPEVRVVLAREGLDGPPIERDALPGLDDIALVQFTSGSTSTPKGVALSHRNLAANIDAINGPCGLATTASDSAVSWLPLYHDMGLIGMALGPLYAARPGVFLTPQSFVKRPAEWLKAISRHRATVSFAPTFGYEQVVRRLKPADLDGLDLSCWRAAGCGAEPIHAATLAQFAERLAPVGFSETSFLPCYGLAEHVVAATFPPRNRRLRSDRAGSATIVSCGRPLPGHELRVIREDGAIAREEEIGEIALAGPSVMVGYYGDPDATAETVRDGWLHTGDLGYVADGELFVCGRAKDTIVANGRKFHPHDLEWALQDLEGVRRGRVAAFGITRPGASDSVVFLIEAAGSAVEAELALTIRRRIGETFGLYVDDIALAPQGTIGRTTSGKIQRAAAKAWYQRHNGR